jgi:histidinol-phosphate/aromatic aminotransferase/cobyric acid decarboxylase-like protein
MTVHAYHGGASFQAIGADLTHLERAGQVITADVLDAWFDPAPEVLRHPECYRGQYEETRRLREQFRQLVEELRPLESQTNYFLVRPEDPSGLAARLRAQNIFVREFVSGVLAGKYLRITVRSEAENRRMAEAMR